MLPLSQAEQSAFDEGTRICEALIAKYGEEQGNLHAQQLAGALFLQRPDNVRGDIWGEAEALKTKYPRWECLAGGLAPHIYAPTGNARRGTTP